MTNKLLLSAVSAAALAFAGSAVAGEFVQGRLGGITLNQVGGASNNKSLVPYRVASEVAVSNLDSKTVATGRLGLDYRLSNPVTISAGVSATYTVKFIIEGGTDVAEFHVPSNSDVAVRRVAPTAANWAAGDTYADATCAPVVLVAGAAATATCPAHNSIIGTQAVAAGGLIPVGAIIAGLPPAGTIVVTTHLNTLGELVAVVSIDTTAGPVTFAGFDLAGDIKSKNKQNINISAETRISTGGVDLLLDQVKSPVVAFSSFFSGLAATRVVGVNSTTREGVLARLVDYTTFVDGTEAGAKRHNVLTGVALTNNSGTANFRRDFEGGAPLVAADIVEGGVVTITSTSAGQVSSLIPTFGGVNATSGASATTASFNIGSLPAAVAGIIGSGFPVLLNNDAARVLNDADYRVTFLPAFKSGFIVPTTPLRPVTSTNEEIFGTVTQDGVHFVAPWTNISPSASGSSTLRISNNGATNTGPVFVRLLSQRTGASGTIGTRVQIAQGDLVNGQLTSTGGIPAGQFITIRASALANRLGDTNNGDLRVTVQGERGTLTAKMRVVAQDQTFETGLSALNSLF